MVLTEPIYYNIKTTKSEHLNEDIKKTVYRVYDSIAKNLNCDTSVLNYKANTETLYHLRKYDATTATATTWDRYSVRYEGNTTTNSYITNSYITNNLTWDTSNDYTRWCVSAVPIVPGDRIRQMIRDRMGPAIHRSRTSLSIAMDVREERARQTLRRIIGEQAFRKFIRDGFITVVPKSGLTYRIYPGHGVTEVYDKGIMVDRLCVVLKGNFPPTDSILMRYLLILNDEGEFSKYAIKHTVWDRKPTKLVLPDQAPLTEEWAKLKLKVA